MNKIEFVIQLFYPISNNWSDCIIRVSKEDALEELKTIRKINEVDEWRIIERTSIIRETIIPDPACKFQVWEASDFGGASPISEWYTKESAERELKRLLDLTSSFGLSYALIEKK
jgi:hypothetical protein